MPAPRTVVPTKLFVGNISREAHASELRKLFERYGEVVECDIIRDYGFVHFPNAESAATAQTELNGYEFKGSKLRVERSNSYVRHKPGADNSPESTVCYYCGHHGHWARECNQYPEQARRSRMLAARNRGHADPSARVGIRDDRRDGGGAVRGWTDFSADDIPPPRSQYRYDIDDELVRRRAMEDVLYDRYRDIYLRELYDRPPRELYDRPPRYMPVRRDPLSRPPPEYYSSPRYDPYQRPRHPPTY